MRTRRFGRVARLAVAVGAAALTAATVGGPAQAATEYDGDATALRIEGLQLTLFPNGTKALPPELREAIKQLQSQAPEELQRSSLALAMPDQVIGQATFPGTDTKGHIPPNPLITADVIEARSEKDGKGNLVSEASVAGLSLGGGVLSADVIRTQCTGDGRQMGVDVSQLQLTSNQDIVKSEIALEQGSATRIPGLGSITFNQQETDGSTYAEGTNVVIDLDSDLSLDALLQIFDITPELRGVLNQILEDLGQTQVGPEQPLSDLTSGLRDALDQAGPPLEDAGGEVTGQIIKNTEQAEAVKSVLNEVVHLGGTITISNAACAQATVTEAAPQPQQPREAVPAEPVAADTSEPPLADTGSPAGMLGMGVAGLAALVAGTALLRLRRRTTS
jgi:hypothetical protein